MAKEKKAKADSKKAKLAEKKQKQEKKAEEKAKVKATKAAGSSSDVEDVDLDDSPRPSSRPPPRARATACFLANPADRNQLLLFGGEYFNGALATFSNDLMVYNIDRDEWRAVTSPNAPLPRSGAAWTRAGNQVGSVYIFGGEFSSPRQGTFYHYNDFWRLDAGGSPREWTRIEARGKTPPARSGHRMTYYKNYIVLFGGFQDTANQTKYLGDLWLYDTQTLLWHCPTLPLAQPDPTPAPPSPSSRTTPAPGNPRGNALRPVVHQDTFFLRIAAPPADAPPGTPPTVRWERCKRPANTPSPARAGTTMAYHRGRGIWFGGVHGAEEIEENIKSEFFPLGLRRRAAGAAVGRKAGSGGDGGRSGRRARGRANEEELLRRLAALGRGGDVDKEAEEEEEEEEGKIGREMPVSMELPHLRFNAHLAVQGDVLYIYGGTFEKGDRECTFDDMYAIDLGRLDGCKEIFSRPAEDWVVSEDEDDDEDDDEDEDEGEAEDDEDEDGDIEMADEVPKQLFTPTKRKKKQGPANEAASAEAALTNPPSTTLEEVETESGSVAVEDGLPHPRPFESRRDFFQRTSNEWQEALMTSLRWKGIQPEALTVKEIKAKAFELSEEKWWDSREEITALEDEQEAAGIGEDCTLSCCTSGNDSIANKMPLGIQRINVKKSQPNDRIVFIKPLKGPDEDIARDFLEKIAAQCLPIMRDDHLAVMSLEEFPFNNEFVGRNFNAGEVVQLVLKARSGHWLPFNYVQMVMMHEFVPRSLPPQHPELTHPGLAHCTQMNHSRAFWAVRNQYADQMRVLWARGFTGEGLWGRGAHLATGLFLDNAVQPGEQLPEHLCGGTYKSRRKRRPKKEALSYREQKERRILKKFGVHGVALGEDAETKKKLEKGRKIAAKPRVAGSARGRELRAAAALARFDQMKEGVKEEGAGSEDESGSSGEDYDDVKGDSSADALDIDGKRMLDAKGRGMIKICEDENPGDQDAQRELLELQGFSSTPVKVKVENEEAIPAAITNKGSATIPNMKLEGGEQGRQLELPDRKIAKRSTTPRNRLALMGSSKSTRAKDSPTTSLKQKVPGPDSAGSNVCSVCSFTNEGLAPTCPMCANVLNTKIMPKAWACTSQACRGSSYRNADDCGVCGVCGERRGGQV
ncbi:hypothetical protein B0H67DRAFT_597435 [Lasiosphaeris hirsuta]|uniref:WLM domain-containing protein n=1 Tax=Lasiosphaeris hirsuta TaxID=260670 RepID=A0AA40E9A6_9PEZI|nr:hypothetical protein B0H67DRAFT_597435 [Lasiosphaeris hirsuta]